jgi:hypothetical protein
LIGVFGGGPLTRGVRPLREETWMSRLIDKTENRSLPETLCSKPSKKKLIRIICQQESSRDDYRDKPRKTEASGTGMKQ